MNRSLIVYYSYTGNTKNIALKIQELKGYDILELSPKVPYSTDYNKVVNDEESKANNSEVIDIKDININLNNYDSIIIGTPVWWYRISPVVRSFLTKYNLNNKRVVAFVTNGGWIGNTIEELKEYVNLSSFKNIEFDGHNLKMDESSLEEWINKL